MFTTVDYHQAEQFILSLSNLPRQEYMSDPAHCNIYLKRTQFFLDILGNPEKKIPHYIHVTGTSGKGSVCTMMASIVRASGKRTGLLVSPHPSRITERWEVNGRPMSKKEFVEVVSEIKQALDIYLRTSPYDMISYFELTTAIALLHFARKKVTHAVLEVGMGGRYCSTNTIPHKDVAIITNIGLDHMHLLGNTKEKIAYEKAGIITTNAPVFTMTRAAKARAVIKREAEAKQAPFTYLTPKATQVQVSANGTRFSYAGETHRLRAPGMHQIDNAILCIEVSKALGITLEAIKKGLRQAILPLRMEIVSTHPLIIIDGAHNIDKMKTTVNTAAVLRSGRGNLHLIVGFSGDKQVKDMVRQLAALKPATVACTRTTINTFRKVADPKELQKLFQKHLPYARTDIFLSPDDALAWSKKQTKKRDMLLVTGSIFLSGEIRELI